VVCTFSEGFCMNYRFFRFKAFKSFTLFSKFRWRYEHGCQMLFI